MKLKPLPSSRLATNIASISKRVKINVLIGNADTRDLDTVVVIGNGTPDDIAFSLIAYHLNGDKIAWIIKPERTRFGVIELLPKYLKGNIRKIVFLIDQEDDSLNTIYDEIQNGLEKLATGKINIVEEGSEKVKVYQCNYGSREFELILVINGLDEIHTDKHGIEDHLLKVAEILSMDVGDFENSKEAWNSLTYDQQLKIFNELKAKRKLVERMFPQQIHGYNFLMEKL